MGVSYVGDDLRFAEPSAANLLAAGPLPRGIAAGVEVDAGREVRRGFSFQIVLLAPDRQPPVAIGGLWSAGASLGVIGQRCREFAVGLDLRGDVLGLTPLAGVGDQAEQTPRRGVRGVGQDGEREVLDPLGVQPVRFAPERQLHLGLSIAAGFGPLLPIRGQVPRRGFASVGLQADQQDQGGKGGGEHGESPRQARGADAIHGS